ncbi:MAG TPA: TetR family transcriptional regulator [Amnibacterium sp.]|nr:TetR family transcriptional regulator [Amnibacterium sp.]
MVRWDPGARERLQAAALELFATRGFEETTAAEIAASVGLTERTFFRHFSDKREALFDGQQRLAGAFLAGLDDAPAGTSPIRMVGAALDAAAEFFPDERRSYSRQRQLVITRNASLLERERHKLAELASAVGDGLRRRGVPEPAATLAAESGVTVFGIAFQQWIGEGERRSMADIQRAVLGELAAVASAGVAREPGGS